MKLVWPFVQMSERNRWKIPDVSFFDIGVGVYWISCAFSVKKKQQKNRMVIYLTAKGKKYANRRDTTSPRIIWLYFWYVFGKVLHYRMKHGSLLIGIHYKTYGILATCFQQWHQVAFWSCWAPSQTSLKCNAMDDLGYHPSFFSRSALDSIHQNHLGREGLRWNDGQLMTCYTKWKLRSYDNMPTYPDDLSVLFVWEIASKLFTQEMVSINLLFDCSIIKHFTQFYADISRI